MLQDRRAVACGECAGTRVFHCSVCKGVCFEEVERRAESREQEEGEQQHLRKLWLSSELCAGDQAIEWSPFPASTTQYHTLCPLCGGTGLQSCMNCLGSGKIVPQD